MYESRRVGGQDCKLEAAELWSSEKYPLLRRPPVGKKCRTAIEQFLTAAIFFCCELQASVRLLPSISTTSDTVICRSSQITALPRCVLSRKRDADRRPDRTSSDTLVPPDINVSTHWQTFLLPAQVTLPYWVKILLPKEISSWHVVPGRRDRKSVMFINTDAGSASMTIECCATPGQNCQNPVTIGCNLSAANATGTSATL